MQATVHRFDPETGAGSVLLDDGTELPFDGEAFERSGLRLLRVGQRRTVDVTDEPTGSDPVRGAVVDFRLLGI